MRNKSLHLLLAVFAALLVLVPHLYHLEQRGRTRNFRIVKPDVLYRCGQLNRPGLEKVVHDYGIRTIITFREHDGIDSQRSMWEEEYCEKARIAFVRIPIRDWYASEGPPPAEETVREFCRVLTDEKRYPRPILMHCYAGLHRTGALTAIYRMEFEQWSNAEAIDEMQRNGYRDMTTDIRWFLENYQAGKQGLKRIANAQPAQPAAADLAGK
jgi:protein tyrosine/serine phosphatase